MGQKKNASMKEWISCTFWCVCWSVGCCTSQSITISIPGTWRYDINYVYFDKRKSSQLHYSINSTAGVIESTEWWHSTRMTCPAAASYRSIESTDGISTKRYVWQSQVGTATMCSIDYIHYLQQQSINLKCPTTLTALYQVPRNC